MKATLTLIFLLITSTLFAQRTAEKELLQLSKQIFEWEVAGKTDSLANIFDDQFTVVSGSGEMQTRNQYLTVLRGGNFIHNNVDVEENSATVVNSTAIVAGKGKFTVTISGNKITLHLSYIEVFTKYNSGWKILGMHASVLPN